jgi:hypothetical protein
MTHTPQVDTARVAGRRTLRFESYDEVLAEAERLARMPVRMLGNWSQGQIYKHLAVAIDTMIDGATFNLPAPMRWVLRTFMKRRMLSRTLPAGFKLPAKAVNAIPAEDTTLEEGLALLRQAIARIQATSERAMHPGFGRIPAAEWDAFQLRHCELHLSFIVPCD